VEASDGYPVHNLNTGLNYTTIQGAIDAPETMDGHTIFVEEGFYYEHLVVSKSLSLIGENNSNTILDGNGTDVVAEILAENVGINEFTVQNGGVGIGAYGLIGTDKPMMSNISSNIIVSNGYGISLAYSHNNTISDNVVRNNSMGVRLVDCIGTVLRGNELSNNAQNLLIGDYFVQDIDTTNLVDGKPVYYWVNQRDKQIPADAGFVAVVNSVNITVQNLNLRNNFEGVLFAYTVNSTTENVNVSNCNYGVALYASDYNTILGNVMSSGEEGIRLETSDNNTIVNNAMINNTGYMYHAAGVHLIYGSEGNVISCNSMSNNYCGIRLTGQGTNGNIIYNNNFINNTYQVLWQPSGMLSNIWDNGFEGNYWSDYNGKDADHDGIGDTPYVIDTNNTDHYPLMGTFQSFNVSITPQSFGEVDVISNFTISDLGLYEWLTTPNQYLQAGQPFLRLVPVQEQNMTAGFCRMTLPNNILNTSEYIVLINMTPIIVNKLAISNDTQTTLYFTFNTSALDGIIIVPEFPSFLVLPLFMIATLLAIIVYRRKHLN
jgi:parallel beta-helix repeat protein